MSPELKAKWLEALRSGRYGQCRNTLRKQPNGYCCLGVLLDVKDPSRWGPTDGDGDVHYRIRDEEDGHAAYDIVAELEQGGRNFVGLTDGQEQELIEMNDTKLLNFNQIADWIEGNVK